MPDSMFCFTSEQRQIYDDLEMQICSADGLPALPRLQRQYDKFMEILFRPRQELIGARKESLTAIFGTPPAKKDTEFSFGYIFLTRVHPQLG